MTWSGLYRDTGGVWLTPPRVIEDLGPFDLDPCGAPNWPTARRHILLPEDGLAAEWAGRVWLNPPYGRKMWPWLGRLADHGTGTALILARTDTAGFVREVWDRATALRFLHGRLRFHRPDGTLTTDNPGVPSVLVAYGVDDGRRLETSTLRGSFVQLRAPEKKEPVPA